MADAKISGLPAVTTPASTDELVVNQDGMTKKQTRAQIHTLEEGETLDASAGTLLGALGGNADTATALATARAINGVDFDGTANITVAAAAETLTGTALKSTVVGSSLTGLGVQAQALDMGTQAITNAGRLAVDAAADSSFRGGGKVGFGTALPEEAVDVRAASGASVKIAITKTDDVTGQDQVLLAHVDNFGGVIDLFNDAGDGNVKIRSYGVSFFKGGDVLIGTASDAGFLLDVNGTGRFAGLLTTVASASGSAGLNLPHGTAPTSPADGDKWTDTDGSFERINGVTKQVAYV